MQNNNKKRNPFMDYRNVVPFMNLSGFIVKQPTAIEEEPSMSLQESLFRKKFSSRVNFRRMQYRIMCEEYRSGRIGV